MSQKKNKPQKTNMEFGNEFTGKQVKKERKKNKPNQ